jgi:glycosyltransferase involved in cell wall biosynthesis
MQLTVLNVSYPLAPVSDGAAGGAEQILATLDDGLVRAGHRSLVIAPEGSQCRGLLLPTPAPQTTLDDAAQQVARCQHREAIARALARYSVDVVHLHGVDFFDYLPESRVPVMVTLHLPPGWYPAEIFRLQRPQTHLVCVSNSQADACPPHSHIEAVIENGIRLEHFVASASRRQPVMRRAHTSSQYALGLGRICPEKGFHLAMDAATACGMQFLLAGALYEYPAHRTYFEQSIRPRLQNGHRFLGSVGRIRKQQLLAGAACLLIPSLVPETSSLVAMEAMACGTPVVAFRAGALCELIDHGRTGFLVNSVDEMAAVIPATAALDPNACRQEAQARFSADSMIKKYLALYQRAATVEHDKIHREVLC